MLRKLFKNIRIERNILFFLLFASFLSAISCTHDDKNYPKDVFKKVKLNGNKIPNGFKSHFSEIRGQLKAGSLVIVTQQNEVKKVNASEYVANHYLNMFDKDIEAIKALNPDDETKPILEAALEMFIYADEIYKTDFPRIAKMIDDGISDVEIDKEITELNDTKGPIIDEKYNKVHDMIIPYAHKHGVDYKIWEMPKLVNYK